MLLRGTYALNLLNTCTRPTSWKNVFATCIRAINHLPHQPRDSCCRSYSTNEKYDIHNPFSEEAVKSDEQITQVVERNPASYWKSLFHVWRTPAPALITGLAGVFVCTGRMLSGDLDLVYLSTTT